jgi:hypothetical protein
MRAGLRPFAAFALVALLMVPGYEARAAQAPAARIGPIIFARGESNTQPVGRSDRFRRGIPKVYAFFNFQGLKNEDVVAVSWFKGSERIVGRQFKMAEVFAGTPREKGHLFVHVSFDDGAPRGVYRLEVRINGNLIQTGSFAVD